MILLVTRPNHDVTTRYLSVWAEEIITLARERGVKVIDLSGHKATKKEFSGRVEKLNPETLFLNGHGSDKSIAGQDNDILISAGDNHNLLKGKIAYALSCDSAKELGETVANEDKSAYIGYKDEFIFMSSRTSIRKPKSDKLARPFMEASNQVMISLLKGNTALESSDKSRHKFREQFVRLSSSTADPDSLQSAQLLWWNMRNQVCLGNGSLRISYE